MGSTVSRLRLIYQTIKAISDSFSVLSTRIPLDPGLPVPNPSASYWCFPPSSLDAPVPGEDSKALPLPPHADVVIIGSGIAGTAVARTLLDNTKDLDPPLRVVMLEARDVCSGATGRNGGHISPNTHQDYPQLESHYGRSAAEDIIRFRLAHLPTLLQVAQEENLLRESQARTVRQFDVYLQGSLFSRAKDSLQKYLDVLPDMREKHKMHEDRAVFEDLQLSSRTTGCISQPGGALHPYRLVTGILRRLISSYPSFSLHTHTPCIDISSTTSSLYLISTPRGTLTSTHVIHAANAWTSSNGLLPGMRRKIVPVRVHMTAQRPGTGLSSNEQDKPGRAFVFYPGKTPWGFDYLTQQLSEPQAGALMFGGGAMLGGRAEAVAMDNIGIFDDSETDFEVEAYLGGALQRYFALGWGSEAGRLEDNSQWEPGRILASWSGIMGLSADGQPWVGRVPRAVSGRAGEGEWIVAGFTGEGMTHAWLCGVEVARMVLRAHLGKSGNGSAEDGEQVRFPQQYLITEKRWQDADIEAFLGDVGAA
ncbi:nucleotide-binding domain-containing protein [Roridomyces roridus]|uniref:Nucleotide-binding domain-containing protein n=1 Tax=Roridomyces roridus TaxID=1738132 RepID=A0AAD7B756_9AGAR|nr:nucleotide-binding domain-containing protein [Roridomyces roridus]